MIRRIDPVKQTQIDRALAVGGAMKIEDVRVVRGVDGKVLGVTVDGVLISKNDNWQKFCEDVASRLLTSLSVDDASQAAVQLIRDDYCRLRGIGVFVSIDTPNHS